MAAKDIERVVELARAYAGCAGSVHIRDQQRLYDRFRKAVAALARRRGMDENEAFRQISDEAARRGARCPIPGKDY